MRLRPPTPTAKSPAEPSCQRPDSLWLAAYSDQDSDWQSQRDCHDCYPNPTTIALFRRRKSVQAAFVLTAPNCCSTDAESDGGSQSQHRKFRPDQAEDPWLGCRSRWTNRNCPLAGSRYLGLRPIRSLRFLSEE